MDNGLKRWKFHYCRTGEGYMEDDYGDDYEQDGVFYEATEADRKILQLELALWKMKNRKRKNLKKADVVQLCCFYCGKYATNGKMINADLTFFVNRVWCCRQCLLKGVNE